MAKKRRTNELDSVYLLKLVMYLIVGSQWLRIITKSGFEIPIPVGAIIGVMFAAHEHFMIDRRIEYAVLLVAMFIGFWVPLGAVLELH